MLIASGKKVNADGIRVLSVYPDALQVRCRPLFMPLRAGLPSRSLMQPEDVATVVPNALSLRAAPK